VLRQPENLRSPRHGLPQPHLLSEQPGRHGAYFRAAIAAVRSGARVGYVMAVGENAGGEAFLELSRQEGVDATTLRTNPQAPTGIYFATHNPRSHQFTFYRNDNAAARSERSALISGHVLTAREWSLLKPLLPKRRTGRPP
jgi:sugar/nucleoside kinase (ribokinase family)